jgi:hypothetical protein
MWDSSAHQARTFMMDREDIARLLLGALLFREETINFNRDQDTRCWRNALLQADAVLGALAFPPAIRGDTE